MTKKTLKRYLLKLAEAYIDVNQRYADCIETGDFFGAFAFGAGEVPQWQTDDKQPAPEEAQKKPALETAEKTDD